MGFFDLFKKEKPQKETNFYEDLVAEMEALRSKGLGKGKFIYVLCEVENDKEIQQKLRNWKISGTVPELQIGKDTEGNVCFFENDIFISRPNSQFKEWLNTNVDKVQEVLTALVRGGGHTIDGQDRPFVLIVHLRLKSECIFPYFRGDRLPPAKAALGVPGVTVCAVSKTGKLHTCPAGCGVTVAGLPRFLIDELDSEQYSLCMKCFKDF